MSSTPADPVTVTFEPDVERGFVLIRVAGKLTLELAVEAQGRAAGVHPELHRLWDFRHADLTGWSQPDMRRFIEGIAIGRSAVPGRRLGAIVTRDIEFGLAKMFGSLAEDRLAVRPGVFRDEAEAIAWVTGTD